MTDTFIKIAEIWSLDPIKQKLILADSYFGEYSDFNKQSLSIDFSKNEGLPGKAWQQKSPVILSDLDNSYFLRKEAASEAGIRSAVAYPVFAGEFLLAVIVLLCGDREQTSGAIELWGKNSERPNELVLNDGYYGSLEKLEWISQRISFRKGSGLPGTIWDYHIPQIISDLSSSSTFLRASATELYDINTAVGIPFIYDKDNEVVLTILSSEKHPIAKRFETWIPDNDHAFLTLYHEQNIVSDLETETSPESVQRSEGYLGRCWQTGAPVIQRLDKDRGAIIAIPVLEQGILKSIVTLTI